MGDPIVAALQELTEAVINYWADETDDETREAMYQANDRALAVLKEED